MTSFDPTRTNSSRDFRINEAAALDARNTTAKRLTVPKRCNKPSAWYAPGNGYQACNAHAEPGMVPSSTGPTPSCPCDYPLDGLGARRMAPKAER